MMGGKIRVGLSRGAYDSVSADSLESVKKSSQRADAHVGEDTAGGSLTDGVSSGDGRFAEHLVVRVTRLGIRRREDGNACSQEGQLLPKPRSRPGSKFQTDSPSRISFHRIKPMLTQPALATAAKGTSLPRRERAAGETRRRGTSCDRPTAMEHEATVAAA